MIAKIGKIFDRNIFEEAIFWSARKSYRQESKCLARRKADAFASQSGDWPQTHSFIEDAAL
jgi:hypothetical protein